MSRKVTTLKMMLKYVISFLAFNWMSCSADNLRLVNVLYRHGNRNPIYLFPKDNNTEDTWRRGLGELTEEGIKEVFELGLFLKTRYVTDTSFLDAEYKASEIYVQSTDVNRCLMSAQAALAGLYPPSGEQRWKDSLDWQPIPVHTVPIEDEQLFSKAPCPRLWELGNASVPLSEYNYINQTHGEFLQWIHDQAGYNWTMSLKDLFGMTNQIIDTIFIENLKGRYLPPWANETVRKRLESEIAPLMYDFAFRNNETLQLRGGAMLHKIIEGFKQQTQPDSRPQRKMFMYSGHDSTVRPLLSLLHALQNRTISYATAVFLELYQRLPEEDSTESGPYYVQLWLRSNKTMTQLDIGGCEDKDCELSRFIDVTRAMTVSDRRHACVATNGVHYFDPYLPSYEGMVLAVIVITSIAFLLCIVLSFSFCAKKCRRRRRVLPRKYRVMHEPEQLPMINSALSDDD